MKTRYSSGIQPAVTMNLQSQSLAGIAIMSFLLLLSVTVHAQEQGTLIIGGDSRAIITTIAPSDLWTFSANAGDSINLRLGTAGFNGKLQLFSPYGELLDTTQDNTDDLITDIAKASGTYTVLVSSYNPNGTGTYGLYPENPEIGRAARRGDVAVSLTN